VSVDSEALRAFGRSPSFRPSEARAGIHNHRTRYVNKQYFVYILASRKHGTLYIGVTNDLIRRTHQHKLKAVRGFTKQYDVHKLMYFEIFDDPLSAITREKQLKKWNRDWKIQLIEKENPHWVDLAHTLI
jgi:putative endonuclease